MDKASSDRCSAPGRYGPCGRSVAVRKWGLCGGHYTQMKRGRVLVPLWGDFNDGALCEFSQCDRRVRRSGYCNAHQMQIRAGKPLTPLSSYRPHGSMLIRDEQGRKYCVRCEQWKVPTEYQRTSSTRDGLRPYCRDCDRSNKLFRQYGISLAMYREMLAKQGGGCAVCEVKPQPGGKNFAVDHDHACCPGMTTCGSCLRGILCAACNIALGHIREDPAYAALLVEYLTSRRRLNA